MAGLTPVPGRSRDTPTSSNSFTPAASQTSPSPITSSNIASSHSPHTHLPSLPVIELPFASPWTPSQWPSYMPTDATNSQELNDLARRVIALEKLPPQIAALSEKNPELKGLPQQVNNLFQTVNKINGFLLDALPRIADSQKSISDVQTALKELQTKSSASHSSAEAAGAAAALCTLSNATEQTIRTEITAYQAQLQSCVKKVDAFGDLASSMNALDSQLNNTLSQVTTLAATITALAKNLTTQTAKIAEQDAKIKQLEESDQRNQELFRKLAVLFNPSPSAASAATPSSQPTEKTQQQQGATPDQPLQGPGKRPRREMKNLSS